MKKVVVPTNINKLECISILPNRFDHLAENSMLQTIMKYLDRYAGSQHSNHSVKNFFTIFTIGDTISWSIKIK